MSYSGMTEQVVAQFDEYDENELDISDTIGEILDKSGDVYERMKEFMESNISLPSTMVKVNCFWNIIGMDQVEEFKDVEKKNVLDELFYGEISSQTEEVLRFMARRLSEECNARGIDDATEDWVFMCLTEELTAHENKEFVRKIALATNLRYSMYQKMLQKMTCCEQEDLYNLDDFVTSIVLQCQNSLFRNEAYHALLKDYDNIKDEEDDSRQVVEQTISVVALRKDLESPYKGGNASSVDNLDPEVIDLILDHRKMVDVRKERTATKVKNELIDEITELLKTSNHTIASQARSLAKGHTMIAGMLRLGFDPEVFTFLPKGYEFAVETEDGKNYSFVTTKALNVTPQQANRHEADVPVEAYVNNSSEQTLFAKKNSLYITPPYPDGVKEISNPFDLMFDSMLVYAYYDPEVFAGAKNVKAYARVGKKKVEIEIPVIEIPEEYSAVVPVVGRKNKNGEEAIEVDRKYLEVKKASSNIWSTTELDDAEVAVETKIKKDKKNPNAPVEGTLRVVLPEPTPIYRDTKFKYSNKYGSYDYYAKETVKTGVIDAYARFVSTIEREKAKTETGDYEFEPVKGLLRIESRHRYEVPNSLFGYLRQIALGKNGEEFVDEERYLNYPLIGDWLMNAQLGADIESTDTVTRNDILTLVFFKYALESTDIEGSGEGEFTYQANEYLAKCHMDGLYRVNTYDRYLSFLSMHTEMGDILNTYSLIYRIALRQRGRK